MCGTEYVVTTDLQMREFTEPLDFVSISDKQERDVESELTGDEVFQLRAVAGSGMWLATQTRVARVSLLQQSTRVRKLRRFCKQASKSALPEQVVVITCESCPSIGRLESS